MPYKDKKKQADSVRRYKERTQIMAPYMVKYRKFRSDKQKKLEEAINRGDLNMAKQIMNKKPNINLFSQTWQDMVGQKRRKRE
jgi:hypothetical protein